VQPLDRQENQRERTHVAARPVTPEPTIATRMFSNCLAIVYVYSVEGGLKVLRRKAVR
jgi:hypothetical protein